MLAARLLLIGNLVLWSTLSASAVAEPSSPVHRSPEAALTTFLSDAWHVIGQLAVGVETMKIRTNRCAPPAPPQGERDDLFYIWIGLRGIASESAAQTLIGLRADWNAQGWHETRFRHLDNGGVNVAATDPETGNSYSFDSGFVADPDTYVVGYLATPCFQSPDGPVVFGRMDSSAAQ